MYISNMNRFLASIRFYNSVENIQKLSKTKLCGLIIKLVSVPG